MNNQNKEGILRELDAAIDAMDTDGINRGISALSALEPDTIKAEDVKLFSARIKEFDKEGYFMQKPRKTMRVAVIAAAIMLMSLTVYAATSLKLFSFQQGDRFITMRTTDNLTEQEAKALTVGRGDVPAVEGAEDAPAIIKDLPLTTFESVQQAGEEMDVALVLPSAMPEMKLDSATGQGYHLADGHESRIVWLTYSDQQGRMIGITTSRTILGQGKDIVSYTTHDIDEGSLDSYKSKAGIAYTLLTESDETGEKTAHIATAMLGEYEYSLVFFGFEEAERQAIIDSADLSALEG